MTTWHEDDNFWETFAPLMFGLKQRERASENADAITSLLQVEPGASVLDLCCGPGRHSLELAQRGYRVTGVDRTEAFLETAKRDAEKRGITAEFVLDDMRRFARPQTFDGAMLMFTSFGYFEDAEDNRKVLINVYRSLKKEGALIIDVMGKEILARIFSERDWSELNGWYCLEERRIRKNWSWIECRWIVLDDKGKREFDVSHWIYSAAELSMILKDCGFGSVEIYGDLRGAPYDHTAKRLVAIARK